jgi:hypothetical protein
MTFDPSGFPKVLTLYLELSQYPILASRIRKRMRQELFKRGVISHEAFEAEVEEKALQSQSREGLEEPYSEEPSDVWHERLTIVRDHLTDFYFAYNLPHERFEDILRDILSKRIPSEEVVLTIHPELAPWDMLFAQGETYESLPEEERKPIEHHLEEIKVVLIKSMISDHLAYVGIAKEWFDIADLQAIRARRLGRGKIGGKAAGLMLAECILRKSCDEAFLERVRIPRSWFLGADVFYQFMQINNLFGYINQKYKSEEQIRTQHPAIREQFGESSLPINIIEGLKNILYEVGDTPLIVRSSSLLEDSFGTSFAGKYESFFCPNQGSPQENLEHLQSAIRRVYASVYNPNVLLYRRRMSLTDYDERMAVLIQEVQGRRIGKYYMPDAAGVALSRNQFRWSPRIDRRAGFLRLVWGMGTRAVDQVGGDYPRLVALSHPDLLPDSDPRGIRRYSQRFVDLIDTEQNEFTTKTVREVIGTNIPHLRVLAQRQSTGTLQDIVSLPLQLDPQDVVLTFNGLLCRTDFPGLLQKMLKHLEQAYKNPVDTEFAALIESRNGSLTPTVSLLQCRPQAHLFGDAVRLPENIPGQLRLFVTERMVPDGKIQGIRYVVYVRPDVYDAIAPATHKRDVARLVGRINERLKDARFILMGPGRWGSNNADLGIPVTYSDIYNTRALIEIANHENAPEPSYGTHFFQDLVEAQIYPLALALNDPGTEFNVRLLDDAPNALPKILPDDSNWKSLVQVMDLAAIAEGGSLEIVMDGDAGKAIAYIQTEVVRDTSEDHEVKTSAN